jgi:hypothetical protein
LDRFFEFDFLLDRFRGYFRFFARLVFGTLLQITRYIIKKSGIKAFFKPFKGY